MKSLPLVLFGVAVVAQWLVPLSQIRTHEQTLSEGTLFKLKCRAPDPYDPLRGRYLAVRPEIEKVTKPEGIELSRGDTFYATLVTGADGLASVSGISVSPPDSGDHVRLTARYVYNDEINFDWPFSRFYLNENLAPEADEWLAENIRGNEGVIAELRVLDGNAVLADLSLGGKPFREILEERSR